MKKMIIATALFSALGTAASAQTTPPVATTNGDMPAVATPETNNPTAPVEGANSFTEAQAEERIEAAGYTNVKDLKQDDKGIWLASGMKDGKSVMIGLDYQGNVVPQ